MDTNTAIEVLKEIATSVELSDVGIDALRTVIALLERLSEKKIMAMIYESMGDATYCVDLPVKALATSIVSGPTKENI